MSLVPLYAAIAVAAVALTLMPVALSMLPGNQGTAGGGATATPLPSGPIALEIRSTADAPIAFSESTLTARAGGEVTVTYLNDSPLQHNIAFFEGSDATAPRIAATEIGAGPGDLQTTTFTAPAKPGSYYFHCDVHPQQMTGTFEVAP